MLAVDESTAEAMDLSTSMSYMFTPVTALHTHSKKHMTLNSRLKEQTPPAVSSYNTEV